jgi:hypothetical protein
VPLRQCSHRLYSSAQPRRGRGVFLQTLWLHAVAVELRLCVQSSPTETASAGIGLPGGMKRNSGHDLRM